MLHAPFDSLSGCRGGATGAGICADPSGYYVNYHSTEFPAGSIRGQLSE